MLPGNLQLIDQGEVDHKILALAADSDLDDKVLFNFSCFCYNILQSFEVMLVTVAVSLYNCIAIVWFQVNSVEDLKRERPGLLESIVDWLVNYKTTDGKAKNVLASEEPTDAAAALQTIAETHDAWSKLFSNKDHAKCWEI